LVADHDLPGGSFLLYPRDELARELARRAVLERLPEELAEVAAWLAERGLEVD
jgi:hypothetical protein